MKKNYLFKNISRSFLLMGIAATTWLSSCKDTSPGSVNFGDSPALIGFQYYGFNEVPISTPVHGSPNDSALVEVTLSVKSIILKTAVTASIGYDATDGASYAAAQTASGDTTKVVPLSDITLANNGAITIAPGQQIVKLKVGIKSNLIDFSNSDYTYIIPLKINSASVLVASNLNVAFLQLTLVSPYQGTYSIKGNDTRIVAGVPDMTLGGPFSGYSEELPTISVDQVGFTVLWANGTDAGGVGGTSFTVNPATNAVTVSSTANSTLVNAPGYNNHYDPSTKTFYVSFVWSTPGTRASTDTLTYTGP